MSHIHLCPHLTLSLAHRALEASVGLRIPGVAPSCGTILGLRPAEVPGQALSDSPVSPHRAQSLSCLT
jgi:hypothetical protein